MLIDRYGVKVFNEYDLDSTLNNQTDKIKRFIESDVEENPPSNKEDYISSQTEKFKIKLLEFDKNNIKVDVHEKLISSEYFPSSGFIIRPGESYPKDVYTIYLPFSGDPSLLRCVPSTRILRTEEVAIEGNNIIFDIVNFRNDRDSVIKEKDEMVRFLESQTLNVNKQVEQYNNELYNIIISIIEKTLGKVSERTKLLESLGTPLKNNNKDNKETEESKKTKVVNTKKQEFDVFISYASEDKEFVKKLAEEIKKAGFDVWYDGFQLGWGDDLRSSIDRGLKNSKYGIVIFSKSFLARKKWTEYELNGLFSKEERGINVILPIWHDISKKDLSEYSPTFSDRIALKSDSIENIIEELKKKISKT